MEREIRIHIQLDHVNIIKLFAAFEDEKNVYMVQEFAGGGDLFEDLKRNGGQIKEKYAVRDVIVPFLNALQYLHGLVRAQLRDARAYLYRAQPGGVGYGGGGGMGWAGKRGESRGGGTSGTLQRASS